MKKSGSSWGRMQWRYRFEFFLEREKLLSKISGNPTVEILRNKKENCSTHRGLHVGSGFGSFQQTS